MPCRGQNEMMSNQNGASVGQVFDATPRRYAVAEFKGAAVAAVVAMPTQTPALDALDEISAQQLGIALAGLAPGRKMQDAAEAFTALDTQELARVLARVSDGARKAGCLSALLDVTALRLLRFDAMQKVRAQGNAAQQAGPQSVKDCDWFRDSWVAGP